MAKNKTPIQLSDHFDYKTLIRFTIPSVLMMVISSVYSIVDGLFVSNFAGSDGFAAVNLMMPIAMMISCIGFMAGAGGSALMSKTLGEKKEELAREQFSLIIYLIIGFSLVIGIAVFLLVPQIARMMGAEGTIYDNCVVYGRILISALPAFMLQILFQNFLVVAEKPQMGMVIAISSGITNIVLDALFIAVFQWGVAGAAMATMLGQSIGGIVPLGYFLLKKNHLLWFTKFRFRWETLKRTCINGFSTLISNASNSLVGIVFNLRLMDLMGSDGVVAYGVVMYVTYIVTGVFMGYSTGIAPVFSYNLGAQNTDEIKGLFKKSLTFLAGSAVMLVAFVQIFADGLAAIFVSYDDGLMAITTAAIRLYNISFLIAAFNIFAASFFAALNNGGVSSILSLTRTLVFQLGCLYILPAIIGNNGIWLSVTVAEIFSVMVSICYIRRNRTNYHYL